MQHEKKRSGRRAKNPEVSVRVSVRPLRANWKPVKRVEFDGVSPSTELPSPAQDQLDSNVWKTKNVRTEFVEDNNVSEDENLESTCSGGIPGLVGTCDCPACRRADDSVTSGELSPEKNVKQMKKKVEKVEKKREKSRKSKKSKKSEKNRAAPKTVSPPPPVPPNSIASRESQRKWSKLYEEACQNPPAKPIALNKIPTVPGQIGMSELDPEDQEYPRTPENSCKSPVPRRSPPAPAPPPNFFHQHPSPKILKRPMVSPVSTFDQTHQNLPPLIPQPTHHCEPPNVQPPPVDVEPGIVSSMVHKVMGTTTTNPNLIRHDSPPPASPKKSSKSSKSFSQKSVASKKTGSHHELAKPSINTSEISLLSAKPSEVSKSKLTIFRRMEQIFYGAETSWWFFVAFVVLTIFAYRSSIDQHTCYYD